LADQHRVRPGVKKEYFKVFGEIMFKGLSKLLDHFDSLSWKSCLRGIISKVAGKLQA
jgi:hypothetical protein